jgi:hypothetical protein
MKVTVFDVTDKQTDVFEGTPDELIGKLDSYYTWLSRYKPKDLTDRIRMVANHQMYFVKVEE